MLELIINKEKTKKTIMLVENGILVEKHEEHENKRRLEGNIYNGRVQNVLSGMQSAFIDIGENRNTFIRLKDLLPKVDESKEEAQDVNNINIKDIVKQGENIVVQVKRDGTDKKGARVSTHINLPGRFVVYMPNSNFITISQKIEDEAEKARLLSSVSKAIPKGGGAIIRTAARGIKEEDIVKDLEKLTKRWSEINSKIPKSKSPELLYNNSALLRRTVIDIIDQNLDRIIVNDNETYNEVDEIIKSMGAENNVKIILKNEEDLLETYNLYSQIEKTEDRRIWLKCGGFITIDRTEALTAIDVNTGKYTGANSLEQTVYKTNREATVQIAKQLRLRDIGGIIVIDYIDMHDKENEEKILELLNQSLKSDRTKCQVVGFTRLNLLEMTRKNMCNNDNY